MLGFIEVYLVNENKHEREYVINNTVDVIAQHFAWTEIIRKEIQFFMSLVVWGALAYWLLTPWLEKKSLNEALFFLTVPHAFRYIGMVFLVPGVVAGPLPETFFRSCCVR